MVYVIVRKIKKKSLIICSMFFFSKGVVYLGNDYELLRAYTEGKYKDLVF